MKFIKKIPLHENTFVEYNALMLRRKSLLQWSAMSVIIAAAVAYFDILEDVVLSILLGISLGLLFMGLSYFLGIKRAKKNAVSAYKKDQLGKTSFAYTIDAKGMSQKNKVDSTDYAWNRFRKIKETELGFYFFYAKLSALTLSKDALSLEEIATIRQLIKENHHKKTS